MIVGFTIILRATFLYKSVFEAFMWLQFRFIILVERKLAQKNSS